MLIECLGRYEENSSNSDLSDKSSSTDSYHAPDWKTAALGAEVEGKVDWDITDNGDTTDIDFQIYLSYNGEWECSFSERTFDSIDVKATCYVDPNDENSYEYYSVWIDGVKKVDNDNSGSGDDAVTDAINEMVKDIMPTGNTGWKTVNVKIGGTSIDWGIYYFLSNFDIDDSRLPWKDDPSDPNTTIAEFTLTVHGEQTDDPQVFSRTFSAWQPNLMTLELTKTITSGYSSLLSNPLYDLSTVYFDVYTASTGGIKLGTITINASSGTGRGTLTDISADYAGQNLYIEERFPTGSNVIGYEDKGRIAVRMKNAGETTYFTVENTPINDPVSITIMKESNLNGGNFIGTYDRSGIEYTLEYYTSKSAASSGSSPYRTWKFKTDLNGEINCRTSTSTADSDEFFTNASGRRIYPVGWYKLYESTSSAELNRRGLELNEKKYYLTVTDDGSGDGITTVYTDSNFSVLPSNTWGNATSNAKIYEKSANTYGTIEEEHWEPFDFYKRDIFLGVTGPTGDATFAGTEFTVYCESASVFNGTTRYNGHDYSIDRYTNAVLVDGDELVISINANTGYGKCNYPLPKEDNVGSRFYIEETSSPNYGYKTDYSIRYYVDWNNGDSTIDYSRYTITVNDESRTYSSGKAYNTPRMGQIIIEKFDDDSNDGKAQGDSSLQGIQFAIVNNSANPVRHPYESSDADPPNPLAPLGEVVTIVTTDSNGIATANKLPYGTYDIYELGTGHSLRAGVKYDERYAGSTIYANSSYAFANTNNPDRYIGTAKIHPDDDSNTSVSLSYTVYNPVVRADLKVIKTDKYIC